MGVSGLCQVDSIRDQIDSRQASMYQGVSGQASMYQIDSIRCIVFGGSVLCRCIYPSWCQVDSWQVDSR